VTILDHLDRMVPAGRALVPRDGPGRTQALKVTALAAGLADKAVSLFYERRLHETNSELWERRCLSQIDATLETLEAGRGARGGSYWFGDRIGHADIAVAASLRHMAESHPELAGLSAYPALDDHCRRCEALEVFKEISQPFVAPA
jgi:glutathione S-transferase